MVTASQTHPIAARLDALQHAADAAGEYLPASLVEDAQRVVTRSNERLRHGTHHTVVALAGPTGAGKSSLFNAIVGSTVSQTGVRRPTTSEAHAAVFGQEASAGPLLDWLNIRHRHLVPPRSNGAAELDGLILLDLPDYDSTEALNRAEVDRLVELVDLLVWVVDPQKYADHVLHEGYLRPLAGHADVMRFVLSKADTLSAEQVDACLADLASLLDEDGIGRAPVQPMSLVGDAAADSLAPMHSMLQTERDAQRSVVDRIGADVSRAATSLSAGMGNAAPSKGVFDRGERADLVAGLSRAAAVEASASAVANQHRQDARLAMGWPLTRWMTRFRTRPIAERPIARTSAVADAEVSQALRQASESAADGLPAEWTSGLRRTAEAQKPEVLAALDTVTHRTISEHRTAPRWWSGITALQYAAMAVAAAGAVWLVVLALVDGFLRIDVDIASPHVGSLPLPTLMLLAGLVLGLAVAAVANLVARVGAGRRAHAVRRELTDQVEIVADEQVVTPLLAVRAEHDHILTSLATALGA